VSSVVGEIGFPGYTACAAAKAGLTGLARSLAKEAARDHDHVNVLASGFAETGMTAAISPTARQRITDPYVAGPLRDASQDRTGGGLPAGRRHLPHRHGPHRREGLVDLTLVAFTGGRHPARKQGSA
jgi:NAD(P)-dependent dehydrogenase (short-subunit alcohol dehydrogenase family)